MDSDYTKPSRLQRIKFFLFSFGRKRNLIDNKTDLDKKLVYSLAHKRIPSFRQIRYIKKFLSLKEWRTLQICLILFFSSLIFAAGNFYYSNRELVPSYGGEYREGLIGSPKYINPLYSDINDVDSDLTHLIYSSLYKRNMNGELENDLSESITVQSDNKAYTIKIKEGVKWHDGSSLTGEDIVFTFNAIKTGDYKSTLKNSFVGVELEKVDDHTVKFVLSEPYAAFQELLVFGILPQELWSQIPPANATLADLNLKPIGTGPFKYKSLVKDKLGIIKEYKLEANTDYYGSRPYIKDLTFSFFPTIGEAVNALNSGTIDGISYLSRDERSNVKNTKQYNFFDLKLPQITAIFFNLKAENAVKDKNIRQALALALDKSALVNKVFEDQARVIDGPILPESFAFNNDIKKYNFNKDEAAKILDAAGWKTVDITADNIKQAEAEAGSDKEEVKNKAQKILDMGEGKWRMKDNEYLAVNLATVDRSENLSVVEEIKNYWQAVNIKVNVEAYPSADIQAQIIKPRNFTSLFYSLVVGSDPDPYAFWHSSQISEKNFNIANYSSKDADQLLEDARVSSDKKVREEKYKQFQTLIAEDVPAIFMYSPYYTYLMTKKVKGFAIDAMQMPHDRFNNIKDWYINTKKEIIWHNLLK